MNTSPKKISISETGLNTITMPSFVLFTILLLPVTQSAKCSECFKYEGGYCTGKERNCPSPTKCLGVYSLANLSKDHSFTEGFARSCEDPANYLPGPFHFNFGEGRILTYNSQVCNDTNVHCHVNLEEDFMRVFENGKWCPKCFRTGYENCASDGKLLCLGDLVDCVKLNGEITNMHSGPTISFAGRGCVSRLVCDLEGKSFRRGTYTFTFKKVKCSKASGALSSLRRLAFTLGKKNLGPQVAFFLPCILGIFAVKIFS